MRPWSGIEFRSVVRLSSGSETLMCRALIECGREHNYLEGLSGGVTLV